MKVRKRTCGGSTGSYVKEPLYTVIGFDDYGSVEYTVKGGKRWSCHPDWLVPCDTPPGPISPGSPLFIGN